MKHQSKCFRNINGIKYTNYADLIYGENDNKSVIIEARQLFKRVKIIPHWTKEYKQLFVAEPHLEPSEK